MTDFYIPNSRSDLIKALKLKWPSGHFSGMGVKQLKAIFIKLRMEQLCHQD